VAWQNLGKTDHPSILHQFVFVLGISKEQWEDSLHHDQFWLATQETQYKKLQKTKGQ